ncbi:MAG TPA: hypothetical protein DGB72_06975 [Gemmatimonadetes bacterium]|nr:hypothetical protein [Gemmatimonadota bacterium]
MTDFAALGKILDGRGADNPCPACNASEWIGGESLTLIERATKDEPGKVAGSGHGMPALMYVCGNCGFIRQHAMFALARE